MEENNKWKIETDPEWSTASDGKKGKITKIVVDKNACIGAASCVIVAPGVFQMDGENKAYVVDPDTADEDTILLAAQSCPVLAIHLYDESGNKIFPEE